MALVRRGSLDCCGVCRFGLFISLKKTSFHLKAQESYSHKLPMLACADWLTDWGRGPGYNQQFIFKATRVEEKHKLCYVPADLYATQFATYFIRRWCNSQKQVVLVMLRTRADRLRCQFPVYPHIWVQVHVSAAATRPKRLTVVALAESAHRSRCPASWLSPPPSPTPLCVSSSKPPSLKHKNTQGDTSSTWSRPRLSTRKKEVLALFTRKTTSP